MFLCMFWRLIILRLKNVYSILSQKQKTSLKYIPENENIIIKEADKGSFLVILDKMYYKTKIQEILKDKTNYKIIDTNIDLISKITKF